MIHTLSKSFYLLYFLMGSTVNAQDELRKGISIGGSSLIPSIDVIYFSDNNVFADNTNSVESGGVRFIPEINWIADKGLNSVEFNYSGELTSYNEVDEVDFSKHQFKLSIELEFSKRALLNAYIRSEYLQVPYVDNFERSLEFTFDPIDLESNDLLLTFRYGTKTSKGNLEFDLGVGTLDYNNHKSITSGYSYSYYKPSATFLYAISSDARVLLGMAYSKYDFDVSPIFEGFDNKQRDFYTGIEWGFSSKSGGEIKVGYGLKDFIDDSRVDTSATIVNLGVFWEPLRYSRVDVDGTREFSIDSASVAVKTELKAVWRHDWSKRSHTELTGILVDFDSEYKQDERFQSEVGIKASFNIRRWLEFSAHLNKIEADSEAVHGLKYNKTWIGIGVSASL